MEEPSTATNSVQQKRHHTSKTSHSKHKKSHHHTKSKRRPSYSSSSNSRSPSRSHRRHKHKHHHKRSHHQKHRKRYSSSSRSRSRSKSHHSSSKIKERSDSKNKKVSPKWNDGKISNFSSEPIIVGMPQVLQTDDILSKIKSITQQNSSLLQTKNERQLYIGNLPPGISVSQLIDLLNTALLKMNANIEPGNPVINAWISSDGHYAFAEFRSIEEANKGFALSNISILGYPLKIGRPRIATATHNPQTPVFNAITNAISINQPSENFTATVAAAASNAAKSVLQAAEQHKLQQARIAAGETTMTAQIQFKNDVDTTVPELPPGNKSIFNMLNSKSSAITVGQMAGSKDGNSHSRLTEKLHVSHIPPEFEKEDIEKLMSIFGKVSNIELIIDPIVHKFNGEAFVEFTNELELQKATTGGMGLTIGEYVLETKKVPISQSSTSVAINALMQNAVNTLASNPSTATNLIGINTNLKNILDGHPSKVLKLKNLVNEDELSDNTYYEDLFDDTQEQCQNYGNVVSIQIPRPSSMQTSTPGVGSIYVEFENIQQSSKAKQGLNGMKFCGKLVEAVYYSEENYRRKIYE